MSENLSQKIKILVVDNWASNVATNIPVVLIPSLGLHVRVIYTCSKESTPQSLGHKECTYSKYEHAMPMKIKW